MLWVVPVYVDLHILPEPVWVLSGSPVSCHRLKHMQVSLIRDFN